MFRLGKRPNTVRHVSLGYLSCNYFPNKKLQPTPSSNFFFRIVTSYEARGDHPLYTNVSSFTRIPLKKYKKKDEYKILLTFFLQIDPFF